MSDLFRKEALSRLHSPDDLSVALELTSPMTWIVLLLLVVLLGAVVAWGVLGRVPVAVRGLGYVVPESGAVYNPVTGIRGRVDSLDVKVGDRVTKGQDIAKLWLPELESSLRSAQQGLELLRKRYQREKSVTDQLIARSRRNTVMQNDALEKDLAASRQRLDYLTGLLKNEGEELKKGFLSRQDAENTRVDVASTEKSIRDAEDRIALNETQGAELENQLLCALEQVEQEVSDAEAKVDGIQVQLATDRTVTSPVDGIVTQLSTRQGRWLEANEPIVTIEQSGRGLEVYAYFAIAMGKRLTEGMRAEVAPAPVEKGLYGSIVGRLTSVGELPETQASLMSLFGNSQVVNQLSAAGPPLRAVVDLERDPKTYSGFKWSSSRGPRMHLSSGTLVTVSVTIEEKRPIDFVIPLFTAWSTGD